MLPTCDVLESDPTMIRLCSCSRVPLVCDGEHVLPTCCYKWRELEGGNGFPLWVLWFNWNQDKGSAPSPSFCWHHLEQSGEKTFLRSAPKFHGQGTTRWLLPETFPAESHDGRVSPFPDRAALITTPLLASQATKKVQWKKAHVSWSLYDHHQVTTRQMRQFYLLREHELSSKLRKYFVEQQQKNCHISMNQSCLHLLLHWGS